VLWSVVAHPKINGPSRACQWHGPTRPEAKNF
jgi:hypothetical protein